MVLYNANYNLYGVVQASRKLEVTAHKLQVLQVTAHKLQVLQVTTPPTSY